jgi:DNA-binding MarR family transcriptional regulator
MPYNFIFWGLTGKYFGDRIDLYFEARSKFISRIDDMKEGTLEGFIFEFIDQCKFLFFPEQWNNTFLDYSKNEVFALFYVYRKSSANMTEIADYLGVPLNTATGIVGRLEKRGVIKRERDVVDKRVVTIVMCEEGKEFLVTQMKELEHYYELFMDAVTEEEKLVLFRIAAKFLDIMTNNLAKKEQLQETKKTIRKIIIE